MPTRWRYSLLMVLCWIPLLATAGERSTYDRVSLEAVASDKVANDTLVAVLYFQSQGKAPAQVAERVNRAIAWGVAKAKQFSDIEVQTQNYQTSPLYQDGKLTGIWQVRQSIRLEGRDFEKVGALLGELQEKLAIQYLGYQLSTDRRREVEAGLTKRAIAYFKEKAELIAGQFGARDFRIVSVDISSASGNRPTPMIRSMAAMEARVASAPVVEAGEREVQIRINGVIELVRE